MAGLGDILPVEALGAMFEEAPFGLAVLDADLRFVFCNRCLAEINGVPPEEHRGRHITAVLPDIGARALRDFERVVRTGKPLRDWEITGETPARPGVERSWTENVYAVRSAGAVVGVVAVVIETSERRAAERERDEALAALDSLFANAPIGLGLWDVDLRYQRVNEALADMNGVPVAGHLDRTVEEVLPDIGEQVLTVLRGVVDSGEPLSGVEVSGRTPREPDRDRHWRVAYFPVKDRSGGVLGLGGIVEEITREVQLRAEGERLRGLLADVFARARAAIALFSGPDLRIELANDAFAELAGLREDPAGRTYDEVIGLPVGRELLERVIGDGTPVTEEAYAVPSRDRRAWGGQRHFAFSVDRVPGAEGRPAGALVVAREVTEPVRREAELRERLERERRIATTLQRALLPPVLPAIPGIETAAHYQPAGAGHDVGGDFYDVFGSADGSWTVVVGDVCGKGPDAAAATAMVRHTLRAEAAHDPAPARLLGRLNADILRHGFWGSPDGNAELLFATLACLTLRPAHDGTIQAAVALAGHPPAVVLGAGGPREAGLLSAVVGIAEMTYAEESLVLAPGDGLVLYTDGVLDAHAPARQVTPEEVAQAVGAVRGAGAAALVEAARALTDEGAGPARDDIAIVALQVRGDAG